MLVGTVNSKNLKGKRFINVAKEFGWEAAVRTWEAKHSKKKYTFLDVIMNTKGFWLGQKKRR